MISFFKRKKFLLVNLIHSSSNLLRFTEQEKEWSNIIGTIEEQRESPIVRDRAACDIIIIIIIISIKIIKAHSFILPVAHASLLKN